MSDQATGFEPAPEEEYELVSSKLDVVKGYFARWNSGLRSFARNRPVSFFWLVISVLLILMAMAQMILLNTVVMPLIWEHMNTLQKIAWKKK